MFCPVFVVMTSLLCSLLSHCLSEMNRQRNMSGNSSHRLCRPSRAHPSECLSIPTGSCLQIHSPCPLTSMFYNSDFSTTGHAINILHSTFNIQYSTQTGSTVKFLCDAVQSSETELNAGADHARIRCIKYAQNPSAIRCLVFLNYSKRDGELSRACGDSVRLTCILDCLPTAAD